MTALPANWTEDKLGRQLQFKYGKSLPRRDRQAGSVPVFGSNGPVDTHTTALTSSPTIIVGRKGSIGEVHFSAEPCWPIDTTYFIDDFGVHSPLFWFWYLKHLSLGQLDRATAIPGLNREDAYALSVIVPPPAEQRRIVGKLDSLFQRSKSAHDELARMSRLVERYKQAVLAAAFRGDLTKEWREGSADFHTGRDLLEEIRAYRLTKATTKKDRLQIERAFAGDIVFPREDELGELARVPDSWVACRIGALGTVCNGSTPSRRQAEYWNGSIPWVSSGEVRNNIIVETRERIAVAGYENSSVRLLPKGTVLLAMIGEGKTRGQSAILDIEATINQNIAAVVIDHGMVVPEFLWRWFQLQYQQIRRRGAGNGPKALNCQAVRDLPCLLPPVAEQREIVSKLNTSFSSIETSGAEASRAATLLGRLDRKILEQAFRGELVPQDPNDDPVPTLLTPIQTTEAEFPPQKRRHRSSKATAARSYARSAMTKSRYDEDVQDKPYLSSILREIGGPSTVEELFRRAQLPVTDFYKQLAWEVEVGHIRDDAERLEAA